MRLPRIILLFALFIMGVPSFAQPEIDCDSVVELWQIQGSGALANCQGDRVDTEDNIVTAVGKVGFFMQTPADRADNDPMTSDGIYAFLNTSPAAWGIKIGDRVNVNGRIEEFYNLTEIVVTGQRRISILSSVNPLPEPIDLMAVDLNDTSEGVHPLERYEGMLVKIQDAYVTAPTNQYDEFGITLTGDRAFREMGIETDVTPQFAGMGLPEWDLNPELIEVEMGETGIPIEEVFRDSRASAVGGFTYAFNDYQIWATTLELEAVEFAPRTVRERTEGEFTIATQNVENHFDITDDPGKDDSTFTDYVPDDAAQYQIRLNKLSEQVRLALGAPDIVGLQEVENHRALTDLILQIYTDDPSLRYASCLLEGHEGRGIDVAYLFRTDHVNMLDCYRMPGSYDMLQPNTNTELFDRPPLVMEVQLLLDDGEAFWVTLINLHIKSLSGIETRATQERRLYQAIEVAKYVQARQTENPDIHMVVLGDMNAFPFSDGFADVVNIIMGTQNPDEALYAPEDDLVQPDLISQALKLPTSEQYSYIFNHNAQVLDHILTTAALDAFITDRQYSRGNADALKTWYMEDNGARGLSDHDGLVIYIKPK